MPKICQFILWFLLGFIWAFPGFSQEATSATGTASAQSLPKLHILGPVDLNQQTVILPLARTFREIVSEIGNFQVLNLEQTKMVYQKFGLDYEKPCHEVTCAYDAGNIMQADYALFTTVSQLQDYHVYTFNLVRLSITKVVWSQVGEVMVKTEGRGVYGTIEHQFKQALLQIDPSKLSKDKKTSRGLLGILDVSTASPYSKAVLQRLTTQSLQMGTYDLIAQSEMQYLLESMKVNPQDLSPRPNAMLPVGSQLGLDYLVYSKLEEEDAKNFKLHLSLYDIKAQKLVRDWPFESSDFRKLLKFEDKFISSLNQAEVVVTPSKQNNSSRRWIKWSVVGGVGLAGAVTGFMWYDAIKKQNDWAEKINNKEYRTKTEYETFKSKANDEEKKAATFRAISLASFGAAAVILYF